MEKLNWNIQNRKTSSQKLISVLVSQVLHLLSVVWRFTNFESKANTGARPRNGNEQII